MRVLVGVLCGVCCLAAAADEEEVSEAEGVAEEIPEAATNKPAEKLFHILPLCRRLEGSGEVLKPGATAWEQMEEGRFYPLGSSFRAIGLESRLVVQFGRECEASIGSQSSFGTLAQGLGVPGRCLVLESGTVDLKLPRNLPEGVFTVSAPGFKAYNLAGESRFVYSATGDGDVANVRCITGTLAIEGRHFKVPAMRAANEIRIRTSQDVLFTALTGMSGDFIVNLDQGMVQTKDYETGETKIVDQMLPWKLSPRTAVRIHRAKPSIGERLSVSVMTFDVGGGLVNRCTFTEGRHEINTGEQGEAALQEKEESAKRAAQEAEGAVATEAEEATEEEAGEETSDSDSSSSEE